MPEIVQTKETEFDIASIGDAAAACKIGGLEASVGTKVVPNVNVSFKCHAADGLERYYFNLNRQNAVITDEQATFNDGTLTLPIGDTADIWHIVDDRLKWDIRLDKKPPSPTLTWALKHHPGLAFHYQPALTQEEIDEGCERPDNVVGSYAVYCPRSNHIKRPDGSTIINYASGKLCHIYRPLLIDSKGRTAWGSLLIDSGVLSITMPTEFYNDAAYPVTIDPTIGYSTQGASNHNNPASTRGLCNATYTYTGVTGDKVTLLHYYGAGDGSTTAYIAVYDYSGGYPVNKLGVDTFVPPNATQLHNSDAVNWSLVNGTVYTVAFYLYGLSINYDTLSGAYYQDYTAYCPDTFGPDYVSNALYTCYADVTAAGGGEKIFIGGVLKDIASKKILVGGAWKSIDSVKKMVGGTWK